MSKILGKISVLGTVLAAVLSMMPSVHGAQIVSYRIEREAVVSSDFVNRLTSLPEWKPFTDALTSALSKALGNELSRERLEKLLPADTVDDIRQVIATSNTLVSGACAAIKHLDTVVVDVCESSRANDVDALVAFIGDVNPRKALVALALIREGKDYNLLVNKEDGFVATFHIVHEGRNIDFGCASVKLPGESRYALLFAGTNHIMRRYETFVASGLASKAADGARHELIVYEPAFRFLAKEQRNRGIDIEGADLIDKVQNVRISGHDVPGASQLMVDVTMGSAVDATNVSDIVAGLLGFVRLMPIDQQQPKATRDAIAFIRTIKVTVDGKTVSAKVRLDNANFWSIIGQGLGEATDKINKQ